MNEAVKMKLILDTENSSPTTITVKGKEIKLLLIESSILIDSTQIAKIFNKKEKTVATKVQKSKIEKYETENTKLLISSLEGECLTLDFSNEFLNYNKDDDKAKENMTYSIVNTVTELNEVNKVKFLINGQTNDEFKDEYVRK